MRKLFGRLILLFALLALVGVVSTLRPAKTSAAINPQINFQGKLTNPDGTNVTDGNYSIVFSLYSAASGGTAIWTETQSTVAVSAGIFQVSLGSVTALPGSVDFNSASIYLGIKVGTDAEMTPRIQFTASPYAFNSDKLGGINSDGFIQLGPGSVQTDVSTNPSIFLNKTAATGNVIELQKSGSDVFAVSNSGVSTTTGMAVIQNATYTSNLMTINNGQTTAIPTVPGGYLPSLTVRNSQTTASRPLFFGYDNGAGTGWATYLTAGACGAFTSMCLDLGNGTATQTALQNVGTTLYVGGYGTAMTGDGQFADVDFGNTGRVIVGSTTTDATQVLFDLDSFSTYADTGTCAAATNQGGLYYNTVTNTIRSCLDGNWEDLVSTAGLGLQLFGIIPDSGTNPGDLASVTGVQNGPCKVSVGANLQTVSWTACTAYSNGRKNLVAAGTAGTTNATAGQFQHLCLTAANGQPALSTAGAETANLTTSSMQSVTSPILCLADIKFAAANNTITDIYDTRTWTTTDKTFTALNTAMGIGGLVTYAATKGTVVASPAGAGGNNIAGVVVATTGAASSTTVNAIIATGGPASVKSITGTNAISAYVETSGTIGYANTVATLAAATTPYNILGNARTAWTGATACTANADTCAGSIVTDIDKR